MSDYEGVETVETVRIVGRVKLFDPGKGYGFIVEDDTKKDIFVHVTGLGGLTIRENDQVEYEVVEGKKGLNAVQVKKI